MKRFKDIENEIRMTRGFLEAARYRESYEKDRHSESDPVFSKYDAEDGADYPTRHYAREAFENIDRKRGW